MTRRREKILLYVAGGLLALMVFWFLLFGGDSRTSTQLRTDRDKLAADVAGKEERLAVARREAARLTAWQRQALPTDTTVGRSLYQNWLRGLADRDGFRQLNIDSKQIETRRDMFTRMSFSLRAHVALADLTRFLYEFYSAGHLQQIRQLDIKALENSRDLDVSMTIEALSLPGADRKNQLTKEPGRELRLARLDDYRDPIGKRNLFAPYSPPPPKRDRPQVAETKVKPINAAKYAVVTGFTEVDGARQVWIFDRIHDKLWRLRQGDEFQVGSLQGTVREISPTPYAVVDFDGQHRRLRDGENLRGGVELKKGDKSNY